MKNQSWKLILVSVEQTFCPVLVPVFFIIFLSSGLYISLYFHRSRISHQDKTRLESSLEIGDDDLFDRAFERKDPEDRDIFRMCMEDYFKYNSEDKFVMGRSVWIDERGVRMICHLLHPNMTVLEYGSGGSTTMFSKYVRSWTSVEHDRGWGTRMQALIEDLHLQEKVKLHIVTNDLPWRQWKEDGSVEQFKTYINYAKTFSQKFNLVINDGRARLAVARMVLDERMLVDNSSMLLIHDWERQNYKEMVNTLGYRVMMEDTRSRRHLACLLPPADYHHSSILLTLSPAYY